MSSTVIDSKQASNLVRPSYTIQRAVVEPELKGLWDGPAWGRVPALDIADFYPKSGPHRPRTQAKILHSAAGIHTIFQVHDQYVLSVFTKYQDQVCRDSCVEFFIEPIPGGGYFNFEINAGGTMLLYHCHEARKKEGHPLGHRPVSVEHAQLVRIYHSLPSVIPQEIAEPTTWVIEWFCPFEVFDAYLDRPAPRAGSTWRGNLYKCGSRKEHWASWASIGNHLSFHQPATFAPLYLQP